MANETIESIVDRDGNVCFRSYVLNDRMKQLRIDWFWTKEPETLLWIDNMAPKNGEQVVLWDVGANVGMYSLYAASKGIQVMAFEPEWTNYDGLVRNVALNGFGNLIHCFNVALCNPDPTEPHGTFLGVPVGHEPGASGSQLCGRGDVQPITAVSGMEMCEKGILAPEYMKVDIDGLELEVLRGMGWILHSTRMAGVLVEVNNLEVMPFMLSAGWKVDHRTTNQKMRINDKNYVFRRKEGYGDNSIKRQ